MKKFLNALPLLIAFALLTYGGWQHDRSRPLGEVWQVSEQTGTPTPSYTILRIPILSF